MATQAPPAPSTQAPAPAAPPASRPRLVDRWPLLIMAVPLVLICLPFWPGHMSADTLAQIGQVRDLDNLNNHHAPLLMVVWKPFYELGAGPGWVLTLQVAAFLAGSYLVLRTVFGRVAAAILASVIALWPSVYGMLGYLSRDTWFAALLVLTFGLVGRATQREGRERTVWIVLAVVAAWLTLAARQNAATGVVLALAVLVVLLPFAWLRKGGALRRTVVALAVGAALTVGLMATQVAASAALSVDDVAPEQIVYIYDLGALSVRDQANRFPPEVVKDRSADAVTTRWNPDSVVGLVWAPGAPIAGTPLPPEQVDALGDAWRQEVEGEPLEYLDVRWELLERNLGLTAPTQWVYHPGIDANSWGYAPTFPGLNQDAKKYVEAFAINGARLDGGILHRTWIYLLVALVGAAFLLRRRPGLALLTVAALGLTALLHQAGLFFGTPQNGYRLEFNVTVTALLVLAVAVGTVLQRRRAARPSAA